MKNVFFKIVLGSIFVCCFYPCSAFAGEWGIIMSAPSGANIMAARSSKAKIKARLKSGKKVKADFLKDGWYAVFRSNEKVRSKKKILGYVAAKSLKPAGGKLVPVAYPVKDAVAPLPRKAVEKPFTPAPLQAAAGPSPPKAQSSEEKKSADATTQVQAGTAGGAVAAATSSLNNGADGIILRDIRFTPGSGGHERVLIYFNRQALPVLSSIQNELPRVVADFENVVSVRPGFKNVPVGGSFIKRVRSSYNPKTRILRIVLDLDPSKNYLVNQVFSQKENIYVFDVSED